MEVTVLQVKLFEYLKMLPDTYGCRIAFSFLLKVNIVSIYFDDFNEPENKEI